jgi:hypothetical protein
MPFYHLQTTINHELAVINITNNKNDVFNFFIGDSIDGFFLQTVTLEADAQAGYTVSNINSTDYLTAVINVPIFSRRFVETVGHIMSEDLEWYDLTVHCGGKNFLFYIGKVKKYLDNLIDKNRSSFIPLAGKQFLKKAVYNEDLNSAFFCARDKEFRSRMVYSEKFLTIIRSKELRIDFIPAF